MTADEERIVEAVARAIAGKVAGLRGIDGQPNYTARSAAVAAVAAYRAVDGEQ